MKNSKINLTIDREETESNDYLLCWSEMGERPNKITISDFFTSEKFFDAISEYNTEDKGSYIEIEPAIDSNIVNEKKLLKLNEKIWITYLHLDKESDEDLITEVHVFYMNDSKEEAMALVKSFENEIAKSQDIENLSSKKKISCLSLSGNGYELIPIELPKADYDNIDNYYNDETVVRAEKMIKALGKSPKGLSIICGEKGSGKTTLAGYIAGEVKKDIIFIPTNMIEVSLSSPEFLKFLKGNKKSLLILDDAEIFFSDTFSKTTFFTTNLLQLVDGFISDTLELNIILILNTNDSDDIDKSLLSCNNLTEFIKINSLSKEKKEDLLTHLNKKEKNSSSKLVDIVKIKNFEVKSQQIGYK
jgi:hypothetical protein